MQLLSVIVVAASLFAGTAQAAEYTLAELRVESPSARPTVPGQPNGAAYVTIENKGGSADRLVRASTPVAGKVEFHTMAMEGNLMKMREVGAVDLKPASRITMRPGDGYHLMLLELKQPLKAGDSFPMTLIFEKAGKLEVTVTVPAAKPAPERKQQSHEHHRH